MRLSMWDFGGQEIYHATHQFFLTDQSLFVLVWNARAGWEHGRVRYWLDLISARAPNAPIILVATHTADRAADLPLDTLKPTTRRSVTASWSTTPPRPASMRCATPSPGNRPRCR
jgi:internalin A